MIEHASQLQSSAGAPPHRERSPLLDLRCQICAEMHHPRCGHWVRLRCHGRAPRRLIPIASLGGLREMKPKSRDCERAPTICCPFSIAAHLAPLFIVLSGCSDDGYREPTPHPPDICMFAKPFAEAVVKDLTSSAAVDLSQRAGGARSKMMLGKAYVSVEHLQLENTEIIGDDGVAVECKGHWRAEITVRPNVKMLVLNGPAERPARAQTTPMHSGKDERNDLVLVREVHPGAVSLIGQVAPDYRALWNGRTRTVEVYGDIGVPENLIRKM